MNSCKNCNCFIKETILNKDKYDFLNEPLDDLVFGICWKYKKKIKHNTVYNKICFNEYERLSICEIEEFKYEVEKWK